MFKTSARYLLLGTLILGGLSISPVVYAEDVKVSSLAGDFTDKDINSDSTFNISINADSTISSGSTITIALTQAASDSSSTNLTSTVSFADTVIQTGVLSTYVSIGASTDPSYLSLDVTSDINPAMGLTMIMSGVHNPTVAGCYYIAMTTSPLPTAATNWEYSGVFAFGVSIDTCYGNFEPPAEDNTDPELGSLTDLTVGTFGDLAHISWDPYQGASVSSYILFYNTDLTALTNSIGGTPDLVVGTRTSVNLLGLDTNTTYYFVVAALDTDNNFVATNSGMVALSALTGTTKVENTTMPQPKFLKTNVGKRKLQASWKKAFNAVDAEPTRWVLELRKKNGKLVKRFKQILPTKSKKLIESLKPDTGYKFRIRARYTDVYDLDSSTWTTVNTKYSKYSKPKSTLPLN